MFCFLYVLLVLVTNFLFKASHSSSICQPWADSHLTVTICTFILMHVFIFPMSQPLSHQDLATISSCRARDSIEWLSVNADKSLYPSLSWIQGLRSRTSTWLFTPLPFPSLFFIMPLWHRCGQLREGKRENQPTSLSSSSFDSPRPLAHERGRTRPMDGRWGVCYVRAPDPDTTQHTTLQATTAGLECDLFQILMPDKALCVSVCEIQVEGGGHG